jgi:hypothetical protein
MYSWSGDEHGFSPELWHQQSEDFEANFALKGKSDSICSSPNVPLVHHVFLPRTQLDAWVSNVHKLVHVSLVC